MSKIHLTRRSHQVALIATCAVLSLSEPASAGGCNSGNVGNSSLLTTAACQATANGEFATAVGGGALAPALWSTAIGTSAYARGFSSTSVGNGAGPKTATVQGATAIGNFAGRGGAGKHSTAIGGGNSIDANGMSSGPHAFGAYSIAVGGGDDDPLPGPRAYGLRSIAVGQNSTSADFGTSVGFNTKTVFASTAIGTDATASGESSSAFGRFALASGNAALALGQAAVASRPGSVAIGSGSLANVANTVSVGTSTARRRIVNVAAATANSDAATLGQVKAIASAATMETLSNYTLFKAVGETVSTDVQRDLSQMRNMIKDLQQEIAELKGQKAAALQQ